MLNHGHLLSLSLILGLLVFLVLPSAYALTPYPPKMTIIRVEDESCRAHPVLTKELVVKKASGRPLTYDAYAGRQHVIEARLSADCYGTTDKDGNYPFVLFIEIRDSDGITQQLLMQRSTIEPWTDMAVGFSWIPDRPGEYEIRSFSQPDPNSRFFTANILHTKVNVAES